MPIQKNNDEIDLLALLLKFVDICRSNFFLILLFFVLGTILGLGYYYSADKVFENRMIVNSQILTESYAKIMIANVNRYIKERNTSDLAALLNVSEVAVKKIHGLKVEALAPSADLKEHDRFLIMLDVADQQMLPEIQGGLISYFENNEYVKVRVEQRRSFLKQMLSQINKEMQDMEEFKVRIFSGDFFQSAKGNIMFDPTTVNSKILELNERKITYEQELQLSNSVQVIQGFTKFAIHTKPKLSMSLASGSFVGLIFVAFLIAFKSIRKLLALADEAKASESK